MSLTASRRARIACGPVLAGILAIACGAKPAYVEPAAMPSQPLRAIALAPGDVVDVKFFSVPELNETQAVRPDGKIALQLVGEVDVVGMTPSEVSGELADLFTPHLKTPNVTVIVREYHGRRVFVAGQVRAPGVIAMPGPMTALEAIMSAGGFDMTTARTKNIVIIRHSGGKRYGAALDLSEALAGKQVDDFTLEPMDIVYVPRTRIVKVAQWIDQHINQLVPMIGVEYSKMVGDDGTLTIDLTRTRNIAR